MMIRPTSGGKKTDQAIASDATCVEILNYVSFTLCLNIDLAGIE